MAACATASFAGDLVINGSTTVLPVVQKATEAFAKTYPEVHIALSGGGSGNGVKALMYSADFFPEEEGEPSKLDLWLEKKLGSEKLQKLVVALAVVLLAIVSALCFYLPKNQSGALTVVIDISGQEVRRVPLSDFTEATVTSRGYTLHIAAEGGAVSVTDSDCPTQDCVHTGAISRAGQSIVCLPAQVVVHLEVRPCRTRLTRSWGEHMKWTAKNIALCAVLAALALGLSTLEGLFPISLLVPLPGVKLGLANIVGGVLRVEKLFVERN